MKKYVLTTSLTMLLASGIAFNAEATTSGETESINNLEETMVYSSSALKWDWYYTDYTLNDGWYEKWYRNHATGKQKKETYTASGKLYRVTYY
ncbi:hypothetical protein [Metasolibacillus meyeri]|uniref:hypothetical protein n=1 Tax=Metasolibacillus meyeri TaxID=1071052 RepID=UPI000D31B889|nr:hypothetical protein [Metasolibacillus meyeri]